MARDLSADPLRARFTPSPAAVIVVCAVGLTILGLTVLFSASASFKQGPYYYLHKQVIGVVFAAVLCFVTSRIDLEFVRRYAVWIGGAALRCPEAGFLLPVGPAHRRVGASRILLRITRHWIIQNDQFMKIELGQLECDGDELLQAAGGPANL